VRRLNRVTRLAGLVAGSPLLAPARVCLAADKARPEPELFGGGQWILSLLSLVLVVFLAYWATRFIAGRYGNSSARHIKVAESLCLGSSRHLYLLIINNQALLIGSSEHGLTLLKEYGGREFCEELKLAAEQERSLPVGKFKKWLAPLLNRDGEATNHETSGPGLKDRYILGLARFGGSKAKKFQNRLAALIGDQVSDAITETSSDEEIDQRLAKSLAQIRAWRRRGRG
jgi:flagellar biogenesis protein FliO